MLQETKDIFIEATGSIQTAIYRNAVDHGFWDTGGGPGPSVGDKLMLIVSELSEALEEYRAGHPVNEVYFNPDKPDKPEGFGVELADAAIRIFDLCGYLDIPLASRIIEKMEYNATRPYKHGGKLI